MPLDHAGWRETPPWVRTHCLGCRRALGPGQQVYCANLANAWNAYCEFCGPKAEAAVKRKLTEAAMLGK